MASATSFPLFLSQYSKYPLCCVGFNFESISSLPLFFDLQPSVRPCFGPVPIGRHIIVTRESRTNAAAARQSRRLRCDRFHHSDFHVFILYTLVLPLNVLHLHSFSKKNGIILTSICEFSLFGEISNVRPFSVVNSSCSLTVFSECHRSNVFVSNLNACSTMHAQPSGYLHSLTWPWTRNPSVVSYSSCTTMLSPRLQRTSGSLPLANMDLVMQTVASIELFPTCVLLSSTFEFQVLTGHSSSAVVHASGWRLHETQRYGSPIASADNITF